MPRKKYTKHTKEEFIKFVSESQSKSQLIRKMGGDGNGGGWYRMVNRLIRQWDVDTSHFTGQGWSKGKSLDQSFKRIPNEEIFVENSTYTQPRRAVIRDNLIEQKCSECGITDQWNDKPIELHLDHINGISNDNRLENLRFLCPNCHSQTHTYCRK